MSAPTLPPAVGSFGSDDQGPARALRQWLVPDRPLGASVIAMPRFAALASAVLVGGAAVASATLIGRPEAHLVSTLPLVLPLVVAGSAVGIGRLSSWLPAAWREVHSGLSYVLVAPYLAVMMVAAAVPSLVLPLWVGPAVGVLAAVPFVLSAVGGHRLRPGLTSTPDAYGRRGALVAALALGLTAYATVRPDYGSVLAPVLLLVLAVAAFTVRGLADAGATWGRVQWAAFLWGALVCWGSSVAAVLTPMVQPTSAHLAVVLTAAAPLAVVSWLGRRG